MPAGVPVAKTTLGRQIWPRIHVTAAWHRQQSRPLRPRASHWIQTVVMPGGIVNLKLPNAVRSGFLPPSGGGGCQIRGVGSDRWMLRRRRCFQTTALAPTGRRLRRTRVSTTRPIIRTCRRLPARGPERLGPVGQYSSTSTTVFVFSCVRSPSPETTGASSSSLL